jgi:DNA-binding LacI/PurR family transcriptional regulator
MTRVCTDETALAAVAVTYLHGLGHRHIAFVGPPMGGFRGERATAIRHVMAQHGLSIRYLVDWKATTFHDFNGETALECLLTYHPRPTAIIGFEDHVAAMTRRPSTVGTRKPNPWKPFPMLLLW